MTRYAVVSFILFCLVVSECRAQDTLPRFTVVAKANKRNVISWTNLFTKVSQISIQRSNDSTRNFQTILTVPDPKALQNGFVDTKAPAPNMFYRLFIVLDSGKYQFSRSTRPAPDTGIARNEPVLKADNQRVKLSDSLSNREVNVLKEKLQAAPVATTPSSAPPPPKPEKFFIIRKKDTLTSISENNFKRFRDSIIYRTRDTLVFTSVDTVHIRSFIPKEIYRASRYVYTEKFGNVMISLPDAGRRKYSVSFFEENKSPIFEIRDVKSTSLIVDKSNFVHAGWFLFELYEDGKLKERNKFYIPKDF